MAQTVSFNGVSYSIPTAGETGWGPEVSRFLKALADNTATESDIAAFITASSTNTLTNKTISGASNTLSNIPNSATTATSANTSSAIVARDANGDFTARRVTLGSGGLFTFPDGTTQSTASAAGDAIASYEVDFSTLDNQTMAADGNYTLDGKTWTVSSWSASSAGYPKITNGTGLELSDSTNFAAIGVSLSTLFSSYSPTQYRVRAQALFTSVTRPAGDFRWAFLALRLCNPSVGGHAIMAGPRNGGADGTPADHWCQYADTGGVGAAGNITTTNTSDLAIRVEWNGSFGQARGWSAAAGGSSWPSETDWRFRGMPGNQTTTFDASSATLAPFIQLCAGGGASAVVRKFKVEIFR